MEALPCLFWRKVIDMNLKKLKKKCPKAVMMLIESIDTLCWDGEILHHKWNPSPAHLHIVATTEFEPRDLYDFFDRQGIHINLNYWRNDKVFLWEILRDDFEEWNCEDDTWDIRPEAEEAAFTKAFELLESKQ